MAVDLSALFGAEFAAVRAFYAARIEACRRGLNPQDIAAAVRRLIDEQTVALQRIADRAHGAQEKQRQERPERPSNFAQAEISKRGLT